MRAVIDKGEVFDVLLPQAVSEASRRLLPYLTRTPLLASSMLNAWLGHELVFKPESLQKTGAFKARGALNKLLILKEKNESPEQVVAFSSGNHSQGVAYAAAQFGIKATLFLPEFVSPLKRQATESYGAKVISTKTRQEAEQGAVNYAKETGACFIHAYSDDAIITGQGTAAYEALEDMNGVPDAIFAPCGGGGLLSGTYLAKECLAPGAEVYGVEPQTANDAAESYRSGVIKKLSDTPATIADGVRTLAVSPRTFHYIQKTEGILESTEQEILYWTQWLTHLLKVEVEPTSALAMAGACQWLKGKKERQRVLIVLSGGNIAPDTQRKIWAEDYLFTLPGLK